MDSVKNYIQENKDRFIAELIELLKMPSISADAAYSQDVLNTSEAVKEALEKLEGKIVEKKVFRRGGKTIYDIKFEDEN